MTAHNSIFGWIHGFRINDNNMLNSPPPSLITPYPIIVGQPTFSQIIKNWNVADTSLVLLTNLFNIMYGLRSYTMERHVNFFEKRRGYLSIVRIGVFVSIYLGMRNSMYRLQGLVPNGLPANKVYEPLKYDYTTEFLKKSVWGFVFQPKRKPTQ